MRKIALMLADGFEEGETAVIADVLRRTAFSCDLISIEGMAVRGAHGITFQADGILEREWECCKAQMAEYEMIVLPGGWEGVNHLEQDERILRLVRMFEEDPGRYVAAMCAAPAVLAKAGVTAGRKVTSYPGERLEPLFQDAEYVQDVVAVDGHLITSRGPATALPFAFAIVDQLGGDSRTIKERFLYRMMKEYPDAE